MPSSPTMWMVIATAIAAAGYVIYRRATSRAEPKRRAALLAELVSDLVVLQSGLSALIDEMTRLRNSVGMAASAEWRNELESDLQEACRWRADLPSEHVSSAKMSDVELDLKLIEVVAATVRVGSLRLKYETDLSDEVRHAATGTLKYLEPAA